MASARLSSCISYKRLAAASSLKNICVFSNVPTRSTFCQNASYCTKKSITKSNNLEQDNKNQVGFADVVKKNTKSAGYLGVIIGGVGITAFMFYVILDELLSGNSSNNIYSKALDKCVKHPKVKDSLGEPIKAYGEESGRGRRSRISHVTFVKDGVRHMRMKFYIQGIRKRGIVNLEVQENESGTYVYRYVYVTVEDTLQTVIKVEDNRKPSNSYSGETELEFS